jgi:hypothetical protein
MNATLVSEIDDLAPPFRLDHAFPQGEINISTLSGEWSLIRKFQSLLARRWFPQIPC